MFKRIHVSNVLCRMWYLECLMKTKDRPYIIIYDFNHYLLIIVINVFSQ